MWTRVRDAPERSGGRGRGRDEAGGCEVKQIKVKWGCEVGPNTRGFGSWAPGHVPHLACLARLASRLYSEQRHARHILSEGRRGASVYVRAYTCEHILPDYPRREYVALALALAPAPDARCSTTFCSSGIAQREQWECPTTTTISYLPYCKVPIHPPAASALPPAPNLPLPPACFRHADSPSPYAYGRYASPHTHDWPCKQLQDAIGASGVFGSAPKPQLLCLDCQTFKSSLSTVRPFDFPSGMRRTSC